MKRSYDYTLDEVDLGDDCIAVQFDVECEVWSGRPGQLYGPPERCYEAQPPEIDILQVTPIGCFSDEEKKYLIEEFYKLEERFHDWVQDQIYSEA